MTTIPRTALQLRSLVKPGGELELSLAEAEVPQPGPEEVLIRVEAAPINPSDLALLLGPADLQTAQATGTPERPVVTAQIPERLRPMVAARAGEPMPAGNEGAGTVVAAGASAAAQALLGRMVAAAGGAMYSQYRCVHVSAVMPLPEGTSAVDAASAFVNPLTALSMVEVMRREGHTALVHTAAASNLGQMLNRICIEDGVALVNVVRRPEQAALLREAGARFVVDTSSADFPATLADAIAETGATIAFDAVSGGRLASQILTAMEQMLAKKAGAYSRYGSSVHKQVYLYGVLDTGPTELHRSYGMAWGVGGWLLTPFLQKAGADVVARLKARVAGGLKTTFASHYGKQVSLAGALALDDMAVYAKRATGAKYLVCPHLEP